MSVRAKYKDECAACFQWIVVDVFGMPAARKNNVHGFVHSTSKNKDAKGCPVMLLPAGQRRSRTPQMVAARASVVAAELQAAHAEQPAQSNEHAGTHTRTRTRTRTSTSTSTASTTSSTTSTPWQVELTRARTRKVLKMKVLKMKVLKMK